MGVFMAAASFGLLTPLSASPDEPEHWRQAYAVWSGQTPLIGGAEAAFRLPEEESRPPEGQYLIPQYMTGYLARCTYQQRSVSASCVPRAEGDGLVVGSSSARSYPPSHYVAVGWVAKFLSGEQALYGMRIASASLLAGLVGLSVMLLTSGSDGAGSWRRHFILLLGIPPSVLFLGGTVNPSATEVASVVLVSVLTWRWARYGDSRSFWLFLGALGAATVFAMAVRPISAVFVAAAISLTLLATAPRKHWKRLGAAGVPLAVFLLLSEVLPFLRASDGSGSGTGSSAEAYLTVRGQFVSTLWKGLATPAEWVGLMGWLDAGANPVSTAAWFAALGLVVLAVLDRVPARALFAAAIALGILIVMWIVLDNMITRPGPVPFWQARYGAPLVAISLMCISLTVPKPTPPERPGRLAAISAGLMALSAGVAAIQMTVRYGWAPAWDGPYFAHTWLPLGNSPIWTVVAIIAVVAGVAIATLGPIIALRPPDIGSRPRPEIEGGPPDASTSRAAGSASG